MPSRRHQRGNALLLSIIVVLVMTVAAVGVIRYASREVAGATAARKQAALTACADAARAVLMSRWKALGAPGMDIAALNETFDATTPTMIRGGHYGDVAVTGVQVIELNQASVGQKTPAVDISNTIKDQIKPYRVVVHCRQGADGSTDARELEVEFGVSFGI